MSRFDAILVPGGGLLADGTPPAYVKSRLDRVLELEQGEPILLLSAGTTHKPLPLDQRGRPVFESVASARYLRAKGVSPERLFTESVSYDTVGNAWFSRFIHTEPRNWRRLLIINSSFHMPRTEAIFRWIYDLEPQQRYQLNFEATSDSGLAPDVLEARLARERQSLEGIQLKAHRLRTTEAVHQWLFTEHAAYAWFRSAENDPLDPEVGITY